MNNNISTRNQYNHISLTERRSISSMLDCNYKLGVISNALDRHSSSISREIKANRTLSPCKKKSKNKCGSYNQCITKHLCNLCENGLCKFCSKQCDLFCSSFTPIPDCKKIKRFPFVCNGCEDTTCMLPRYYYNYKIAQDIRNNNVTNHKYGLTITDEQIKLIDPILSNGVSKCQSIPVIVNCNDIPFSCSTIYKYTRAKLFSFDLMDLKKVVNRKLHKPKSVGDIEQAVSQDYLTGRTYNDYLEHLINNKVTNLWQLDTVKGKLEGSTHCILSLLHTTYNLQLFFKLKSCTQVEVIRVFDNIKLQLGEDEFSRIFELILTDNGSEFKDPISISYDVFKQKKLIEIFYCGPKRSDQKGKCEKNHVHFRELVPNGIDMKPYTVADINYISNQINNYPRNIFEYKTPYILVLESSIKKILELNNLCYIPINEVDLSRIIK